MTKYESLSDRINSGLPLTEQEQLDVLKLVTERCRDKTVRMVARSLRCVPDISNWGIYSRVYLSYGDNEGVSYCAGQSYPDEIRTVRQLLKIG